MFMGDLAFSKFYVEHDYFYITKVIILVKIRQWQAGHGEYRIWKWILLVLLSLDIVGWLTLVG